MYTIKRAAELVGISAATLRAWERRYGVVSPSRSDGGYRLYGDDDLRILEIMARLVADGWTPSVAAKEARRVADASPAPSPALQPGGPAESGALGDELIAAAAALDAGRLATVLDELFAVGSYEAVVDRHLLPAMVALGEAWAAGRVTVAGEHLASHAVMRRLAAAFEAAASFGPVSFGAVSFGAVSYGAARRVLIGLPPGARHEIGAFAFAVAARRRGLGVDYLGADLPVADWGSAIADDKVGAVVLAIPMAADAGPAREVVEALRAARPELSIVAVGGGEQGGVPDAVPLGHDVAHAAAELVRLLNRPSP